MMMPAAARERRYAITLLVVSIAVLAVGSLVRRLMAEPKPAAPPPMELEILQRLTADRRLRDLSAFLSEKAYSAARRLTPTGLAWDSHTLLVPVVPAPRGAGAPFAVRQETSDPTLPPVASIQPRPGDWLLAIARDSAGDPVFVHGLFEGVATERCGSFDYDAVHLAAPLAPTMVGGGLFFLDGSVAAFIASCEGRPIAIATSTIANVLAHPPSPGDLIEQRYGFRLAPDPPGLVVSVWDGSPAAAAGLRPGDTVDPAVDPPAEARRGRRTVKLAWPEDLPPAPAIRGISFDGSRVSAVAPGSPAEAAGIQPGDVIPRIAGSTVADPARSLNRAKGPVTVTIERHGRRRETLLQP